MIALLLALVAHGAPPGAFALPDSVDLDDIDGYAVAAEPAMQVPSGCWNVQGHVVWAWMVEGEAFRDQEGRFQGRLEDGVWTSLSGHTFTPMIGRHSGERSQVVSLSRLLGDLEGDIGTEVLEWDRHRARVELIEQNTLREGRGALVVKTWFPGESRTPSGVRITVGRTRLDGGWLLRGAGLEIDTRQLETGLFPTSESLSARLRKGGQVLHVRQTLEYDRFRPCEAGGQSPNSKI